MNYLRLRFVEIICQADGALVIAAAPLYEGCPAASRLLPGSLCDAITGTNCISLVASTECAYLNYARLGPGANFPANIRALLPVAAFNFACDFRRNSQSPKNLVSRKRSVVGCIRFANAVLRWRYLAGRILNQVFGPFSFSNPNYKLFSRLRKNYLAIAYA